MNKYTDYLGIDISKETFDVVNQYGKVSRGMNFPLRLGVVPALWPGL